MEAYQRFPDWLPHDWCLNDKATARFHHLDLPELTGEQLWAESVLLSVEFARIIVRKDRPKILGQTAGRHVSDHDWLRCRLSRLNAELRRRSCTRD
jgi:hypothetical protein